MQTHFEAYFQGLRQTPLREQTEHTSRSYLESLLREMAGPATQVQHEPKRSDKGAPDFKIQRKGQILGYVEVKKIGVSLDEVLKSEQIARYRTLSENIILTDYLEWIWLDAKGVRGREILAFPTDLEGKKPKLKPERVEAVKKLIGGFFSEAPQGLARSEDLAYALATRSRLLRDYLAEELILQTRESRQGKLHGLFETFRKQVFHELTTKDFADAFAQMLAYGLFLAKLNAEARLVTLNNVKKHIPGSFRLIRELVQFIEEMEEKEYSEARWVVDEILSIVNGLNLASILEDLSFRARKAVSRKVRAGSEEEHRLFERDPFIYFYEDYLKHYDPAMRKSRGVYYTPPPVVNFIVRAVDDLLKDTFKIEDGLADSKRVTVLDFACGTGTFILEVFEKIFDNIGGPESGRADHIVREHMLRNVHGFEYLIAPYTIAHLKLSHYLREKGHGISDNSRLQIFLTNTLEPIDSKSPTMLLPALAAEVEAAQHVKDKPILVILGNPPYSGHSKNNGAWIKKQIDEYKHVYVPRPDLGPGNEERRPLGERNPKWLNDDYVKFIRFAQHKMDQVDEGIVGIITNHSWLDNPTFRGMRQSLMRSFDQIYVLDLHGNTKKKETGTDTQDENVFDIEQGVSICILVKHGKKKSISLDDLWGKRIAKYDTLTKLKIYSIEKVDNPTAPDFLMKKVSKEEKRIFNSLFSLREIYEKNSLGIITKRDRLVVAFEEETLSKVIHDLKNSALDDEYFISTYGVPAQDNDKWNLRKTREYVGQKFESFDLRRLNFRPFDERRVIYDDILVARTNRSSLGGLKGKEIALLSCRQWGAIGTPVFDAVWVTSEISDINFFRRGGAQAFPLTINQSENLSPDFRAFIDARYDHHYAPEEIFGFIYAVLHAPTYRTRYSDFLRIDFPRIPFPDTREYFETLSALGWDLVQVHLLQKKPKTGLGKYHGKGKHEVEKVAYAEAQQAVRINADQFFAPVPQAVWEFHIGGYQVIDKYLKSRKGRVLTLDEIDQVARICEALSFTIAQMEKIDAAYKHAFPG